MDRQTTVKTLPSFPCGKNLKDIREVYLEIILFLILIT